MSHKKIMQKASHDLLKDANKYVKEEKMDKKNNDKKKLKHHMLEEKEARRASIDLKKRAKKAHE